jgi:hypothetical protein
MSVDSSCREQQELADQAMDSLYYKEGERVFVFQATFTTTRDELASPEAINSWRLRELEKIFAEPEERLFLGEVSDVCLRGRSDETILTDPLAVSLFINNLLSAGHGIVVGYKADVKVPALAAWVLKTHGRGCSLRMWRPPSFELGAPCAVSDTARVFLRAGRGSNDLEAFARRVNLVEAGVPAVEAARSAVGVLEAFRVFDELSAWVREHE